jgi:hypothetical protein
MRSPSGERNTYTKPVKLTAIEGRENGAMERKIDADSANIPRAHSRPASVD